MSAEQPPFHVALSAPKGGSGATLLVANAGLYLASIGKRVALVEVARTHPSMPSYLGLDSPTVFGAFDLPPVAFKPRSQRGSTGPEPDRSAANEGFERLSVFSASLPKLADMLDALVDFDIVLIDLGGENSDLALDVWLDASLPLLVTTPQRPAVEASYHFVKRLVDRCARRFTATLSAEEHWAHPLDLADRMRRSGAHRQANRFEREMMRFSAPLVINSVRTRADADLGADMASVLRRRLGLRALSFAQINHDDSALTAIRTRRPLLAEAPGSKTSRAIERFARRILSVSSGKLTLVHETTLTPRESYYAALEVERGATDDEVRRAYKRQQRVFAVDSLATAGMFTLEEHERVLARGAEAQYVLLEPSLRKAYDASFFATSAARPVHVGEHDAEALPPAPDIDISTHFTGPLLRALRESRGVSLPAMSEKTRIGTAYLNAIEGDEFGELPAGVYVRGFLRAYAEVLGLDSRQVTQTYVARMRSPSA